LAGLGDQAVRFTARRDADTTIRNCIKGSKVAAKEKAGRGAKEAAKRLTPPKGAARPSLRQLGRTVDAPASPAAATLETVVNPQAGVLFLARFTAPEFTTLCPVTGQPDFAHLVIDYAPAKRLVESKSLKLFLTSFRNHGAFHEDCTLVIAKRVIEAAKPHWLRIAGYWYPRGGIPIDVFFQTGEPPKGLYIPASGVAPYRGRG
jgi:7-cyano-7-deazaguanine reductase